LKKKPISVKKILNNPQKFILYEEIYSLIQKEICFFLPYKNSINYLFTSKSKQTVAADVFKKPQAPIFFVIHTQYIMLYDMDILRKKHRV